MTLFLEVEQLLEQLLNTINENRMLILGPKTAGFSDVAITAENLEDMAANHFFDDRPHKFGITERDAHKLRAFFQEGSANYNFIVDLHKRFPKIMQKERDEYIERVNMRRKYYDLDPIDIKY